MRNETFSSGNILGFTAFALAGVGVYAAIDNQWKISAACGGGALLCLYAGYSLLKNRLSEKHDDEKREAIWRETDSLHERINKLEDSIESKVNQTQFGDTVRGIEESLVNLRRDQGMDFDAVYRHISDEMRDVHQRIDSGVSETACVGKRK